MLNEIIERLSSLPILFEKLKMKTEKVRVKVKVRFKAAGFNAMLKKH